MMKICLIAKDNLDGTGCATFLEALVKYNKDIKKV